MSQLSTVPEKHNLGLNCARIHRVQSLEELVRRRVRTLYDTLSKSGEKWTAEKLAPFLEMSDPSGVRKLLNGNNRISLAHVQGFCEAFQVTPPELVSPEGAPFVYLKESEPTLIARFREMDAHERTSLMVVLQSRRPAYAIAKGRKARMGRAELTAKEQELVDLFARVKREGVRDGVVRTLRAAAQDDRVAAPGKPRTTG